MTDATDRIYERLLVLRCQTRDHAAFTELVARYDRRLRYFVNKMRRADAQLDDLLQGIWFDVFRSIARLHDAEAFPAWLYRIARNRTCRELRRNTPFMTSIEDHDPASDAHETFDPEDAAIVHHALDQIAPEHREVLILRFVQEMPYDEIATVIGCQMGTVRSRLHYAKRALRELLERNRHHVSQ